MNIPTEGNQNTVAREDAVPGLMNTLANIRHDDIFLQPHADDICFSLGLFARMRQQGILLTVFPLSRFLADPERSARLNLQRITELRLAEDRAFAADCGLRPLYLRHADAGARGEKSFGAVAPRHVAAIEQDLLRALLGPALGRATEHKSWLFCPAGVGGHVDHLTVLQVVANNLPILEQHYRIGFYEDLHYASDSHKRREGLSRLHRLLAGQVLSRVRLHLDVRAQEAKMKLVHLYPSQLAPFQRGIATFTPAVSHDGDVSPQPHEALWIIQSERHQRSG